MSTLSAQLIALHVSLVTWNEETDEVGRTIFDPNLWPALVAVVEAAETQDRLRGGEHTLEDSVRANGTLRAALAALEKAMEG